MPRSPLPWILALSLAGGCSSTPRGPASSPGTAIVPLSASTCLVFSERGAERLEGEHRTAIESPAPHALPLSAASDPSGGWAAVAYPDALIVIQTAEEHIRRVNDVQWEQPPQALGICGTTIGTIEDGTIALYDALEGERLWKADGGDLLRQLGLEELLFVQPITRERILVVAFKRMNLLENPEAMIIDLDRSTGTPVSQDRPFGRSLHSLEACSGDGRHLYVAGTRQDVENVGPRQQQMTKTVIVLHYDPERGSNHIVVEARQKPMTEVGVRALAAGWGLLVLALDDGRVQVYDATGDRQYPRLWESTERGVTALACVDPNHIAVVRGDEVRIHEVR